MGKKDVNGMNQELLKVREHIMDVSCYMYCVVMEFNYDRIDYFFNEYVFHILIPIFLGSLIGHLLT